MTRLFITSSGTGIGKTYVTAELTRQIRARGKTLRALKPVISGYTPEDFAESDTAILLEAAGLQSTPAEIDRCSPWRFAAPLSPDMAAALEGKSIDFSALVDWCKAALAGPEDTILIEGVGGAMVPIDETHTIRDWVSQLDVPAVLVVGSYLGTISHTLTAFTALGGKVKAIIVNETADSPVSLQGTAETIERFTKVPVLPVTRLRNQQEWDHVVNVLTT